jgi:hypothetical protein
MATTTYGTPYVSGTDLVANWPAASLTVADSIDAAGYYIGRGNNTQTGSYTTVLTDAGKTVTMSNASANTVTIPANASVAYVIGTRINILNLGAGACTPTAGAGVTIAGTITALATNESASLVKTATNTWSYLAAPTPAAPGMSLVTPTSVAGTGVTLSGGQVSFSSSSTISVNGCFTSAYEMYRITFTGTTPGAADITLRLRVAGVDSSTGYSYGGQYFTQGGASGYVSSASASSSVFASTASTTSITTLDVSPPFAAAFTSFVGLNNQPTTAIRVWASHHAVATSYDGFTLLGTGITGTVRIYGYRNS